MRSCVRADNVTRSRDVPGLCRKLFPSEIMFDFPLNLRSSGYDLWVGGAEIEGWGEVKLVISEDDWVGLGIRCLDSD